jgi:hypothetical protein
MKIIINKHQYPKGTKLGHGLGTQIVVSHYEYYLTYRGEWVETIVNEENKNHYDIYGWNVVKEE